MLLLPTISRSNRCVAKCSGSCTLNNQPSFSKSLKMLQRAATSITRLIPGSEGRHKCHCWSQKCKDSCRRQAEQVRQSTTIQFCLPWSLKGLYLQQRAATENRSKGRPQCHCSHWSQAKMRQQQLPPAQVKLCKSSQSTIAQFYFPWSQHKFIKEGKQGFYG